MRFPKIIHSVRLNRDVRAATNTNKGLQECTRVPDLNLIAFREHSGISLEAAMNIGKTLFAQLMDFLPWSTFERIVARYGGDRA